MKVADARNLKVVRGSGQGTGNCEPATGYQFTSFIGNQRKGAKNAEVRKVLVSVGPSQAQATGNRRLAISSPLS